MIRCPVCEHVQASGAECDVCGKRFTAGPAGGAAAVASLEGLELTQVTGGRVPVQVPALAELEGTRFAAAPELGLAPMPDLEPTAAVAVWGWEEPAGALADLDTGRSVDTEPRTAAVTGPVMCRYCRNVQNDGALCDRCGMRLPRSAGAAGLTVLPREEGDWVRCPACAVPVRSGQTCVECGVQV